MGGVDRLLEILGGDLLFHIEQNLALHVVEALGAGGLFLFDLNDVVAVFGFDDAAELAGGESKGGLFKVGNGLAVDDPAELAAFFG